MRHNISNSQHAPRVLCHTTHHGTAQNRWLLTSADHCNSILLSEQVFSTSAPRGGVFTTSGPRPTPCETTAVPTPGSSAAAACCFAPGTSFRPPPRRSTPPPAPLPPPRFAT